MSFALVAQNKKEGEDDRTHKLRMEAQQRLWLYCHLCTRKHELLVGLAKVYTRVPLTAKTEIDRQLPLLVRSIGPASKALQDLLRDFTLLFPDPSVPPPLDFA